MLMDFLQTSTNATLRYYIGNMQLHIELDVVYLVLPGSLEAEQRDIFTLQLMSIQPKCIHSDSTHRYILNVVQLKT